MRDLMVDFIVSLDGCAAAAGWPGLWGMGGPDYYAFLGEQEARTTLMGATTYRLMSGMAEDEPDAFAELDHPDVRLDLVESRTFDGRLQLLDYRPTVLDGPPLARRSPPCHSSGSPTSPSRSTATAPGSRSRSRAPSAMPA